MCIQIIVIGPVRGLFSRKKILADGCASWDWMLGKSISYVVISELWCEGEKLRSNDPGRGNSGKALRQKHLECWEMEWRLWEFMMKETLERCPPAQETEYENLSQSKSF